MDGAQRYKTCQARDKHPRRSPSSRSEDATETAPREAAPGVFLGSPQDYTSHTERQPQQHEAMAGAWGVIASLIPVAELPALEEAVGASLVEKCTDLRREADALRDIVEDYASQNARDSEREDATDRKRMSADRLGDGPEREMLERKVQMLLDYLGGAGSEAEKRVADAVRQAAAARAKRTPTKRPGVQTRTPPPAPRRPMDALADLFIDRGGSPDVAREARSLLEREAEDLMEEVERLTTFFDEEEEAVCRRHRRTPEKADGRPSMAELRKVSQRLEAQWLQQEHKRDVRGVLARAPGGAIVDSPVAFGKSKLVGECLDGTAFSPTIRKSSSPEGGRLVQAQPRRSKPKNRLREKMTVAREEKFLQEW